MPNQSRLPPNDEERKQRIQEELKRRIDAILHHAAAIYDLMESGMTISVMLEEPQAIIVPNAKPNIKKLLITRPAMYLDIKG